MSFTLRLFKSALSGLMLVSSVSAIAAPSKILFGSCGHQDKAIPIFDAINKEKAVSYTPSWPWATMQLIMRFLPDSQLKKFS